MNGITNIFLRGVGIVGKMLALLLTAWLGSCAAQGNELVMATTFSPSATVWIIDRWQKEPGSVMIRTLNRTSASLEQLLDRLLLHMETLLNKSEPAASMIPAGTLVMSPGCGAAYPITSPGSAL